MTNGYPFNNNKPPVMVMMFEYLISIFFSFDIYLKHQGSSELKNDNLNYNKIKIIKHGVI